MNMKKKIATMCLCAALAATTVIGGSLAYLTSNDEEVNTFTVGNVAIDLIESQYHRVNAGKGNATGEKEPIIGGYLWAADVDLQGTPENTPNYATGSATNKGENTTMGYFSDEQIKTDAATYKDGYFPEHSQLMVPGANVRKNPYVINEGKNDAYVRVRALIPVELFKIIDNGPSYWTSTAMEKEVSAPDTQTIYTNPDSLKVTRDTGDYYQLTFTYNDPLPAGQMTFWNVWGNIAIDKNATAEDLAVVNEAGFDVIFEADAIQAEGFADAASAFAAFDAQTTK